ncbi:MAG: hypothetical protein LUI12_04535 [Clostridiales bacterium]|nr:hypothetical protein [Clostridiales bacterium]
MGMNGLIDVLFVGSGIYLIYTACMAKRNGTVAANVMLDKNTDEKNIKDKTGYIEYMYKRIILAGALIIVAGIVNLVNDYYLSYIALNWVGIIMILVAIIIYALAYRNGRKQYMELQNQDREERERAAKK